MSRLSPSEAIKKAEAMGVTQARLSSLVGVSRPTITRWKAGRGGPDAGQARVISEVIGEEVGHEDRVVNALLGNLKSRLRKRSLLKYGDLVRYARSFDGITLKRLSDSIGTTRASIEYMEGADEPTSMSMLTSEVSLIVGKHFISGCQARMLAEYGDAPHLSGDKRLYALQAKLMLPNSDISSLLGIGVAVYKMRRLYDRCEIGRCARDYERLVNLYDDNRDRLEVYHRAASGWPKPYESVDEAINLIRFWLGRHPDLAGNTGGWRDLYC